MKRILKIINKCPFMTVSNKHTYTVIYILYYTSRLMIQNLIVKAFVC